MLQKRAGMLKYTLLFMILFGISFLFNNYEIVKQRRIVVYNVKKASAYDFIDGRQNYFVADTNLIDDQSNRSFNIQNNWIKSGLRHPEMIKKDSEFHHKDINSGSPVFYKRNNFIQFYNKRIVIINEAFDVLSCSQKTTVDFIILSENAKVTIEDLSEVFDFELIIMDSSNSFWKLNKWVSECEKLGLTYYSVQKSGAFVIAV